jgi:hypothetical protein
MALTIQQTFDKVADHLLTQNAKSKKVIGGDDLDFPKEFTSGCAYRGEKGRMCAVGCLIPDELYDPQMENKTSSHVLSSYPKVQELFENVNDVNPLLNDLQALHDDSGPYAWLDGLTGIAEQYNLSKEVLKKYESV